MRDNIFFEKNITKYLKVFFFLLQKTKTCFRMFGFTTTKDRYVQQMETLCTFSPNQGAKSSCTLLKAWHRAEPLPELCSFDDMGANPKTFDHPEPSPRWAWRKSIMMRCNRDFQTCLRNQM